MNAFKHYVTVADLVKSLGVTRARVHKLIKQYRVKVDRFPSGALAILKTEARKIPAKRQNGRPTKARKPIRR